MDGVIVDSEPIYRRVEQQIFRKLEIAVSPARHAQFTGLPLPDMWAVLKAEFSLEASVEKLMTLEEERIAADLGKSAAPIDGVIPLLDELASLGLRIGLASSSSRAQIDLVLDKLGIRSYFHCTRGGDEVENGKPSPDIFLACACCMGVLPYQTFVLEDSENGVMAASRAGMHPIGYASPNSTHPQDLSLAEHVVADIGPHIARYVEQN